VVLAFFQEMTANFGVWYNLTVNVGILTEEDEVGLFIQFFPFFNI